MMNRMIPQGSVPRLPTVAIIGGGQLALMLARAASQLGLRTRVLDSSPMCPAQRGVTDFCEGSHQSQAALNWLAMDSDVVTLENEFVEASMLANLEAQGHEVWPSSRTMSLVQDKFVQKQTLQNAGVPVTGFNLVAPGSTLDDVGRMMDFPFVLKRRCLGYDGTGNFTVHQDTDWSVALKKLGGFEAGLYAERWCPFERELAVMVTRCKNGEHVIYPVVETRQKNHVCEQVIVPAVVPREIQERATQIALQAVQAVDGVGSFGVEFFLLDDGSLLVNEIAPRVHNSGHYTIEACECSQFENHIRAIRGLPLGSTKLRAPAAMVNLLASVDASGTPRGIADALAISGANLHLYGKLHATPGRKMGHITAMGKTADEALAIARRASCCIHFDQPLLS